MGDLGNGTPVGKDLTPAVKTKTFPGGWEEEDEVGNEAHSSGKLHALGPQGELDQRQRQGWNTLYLPPFLSPP